METISLPNDYTQSLAEENKIIDQINENFDELLSMVENMSQVEYSEFIPDFESYSIDLFFSDNKKKANIEVFEDVITVIINSQTIRIDADGNII